MAPLEVRQDSQLIPIDLMAKTPKPSALWTISTPVDAKRAAAFFKQNVSKQQWVKQLESVRPAFGNLVTRKIQGQNHTTSLPGAPDGEYVVIQFYTSFTNKKNAIETVTPMLEKDGEWRVTGFYIR